MFINEANFIKHKTYTFHAFIWTILPFHLEINGGNFVFDFMFSNVLRGYRVLPRNQTFYHYR